MKNSNAICWVNGSGGILLPKAICQNLQIKRGMPFEVTIGENGSIILTPYLTKAEKLDKWVNTVLTAMVTDLCETEFYFRGSAIVCVREQSWQTSSNTIGIAVCSPNDNYDETIGKCIAYCRAANMSIPDFLFKD